MIWPNEEIETALLNIPTVKVKWGRSQSKMGFGFLWSITIERENGIHREAKSFCENVGVIFCSTITFIETKNNINIAASLTSRF